MVDELQADSIVSIKANAPDGATHYREYTGQYFKINSNEWLVFRNGKFQK